MRTVLRANLVFWTLWSAALLWSYFNSYTVGSLVHGLKPAERKSIHINVLLADRNPEEHFAYGEEWLTDLVDQVLVYGEANSTHNEGYKTIPYKERTDRVESMRMDHSALVAACQETGSRYFALIEDDVIASPDWFRKMKAGLAQVEAKSRESGREWVYLRLFYSETFMGWNSEEAPTYMGYIALLYAVILVVCIQLWRRRRRPGYQSLKPTAQSPHTFNYIIALVIGLWTPAAIALFFLTGRVTINRLNPFHGSGIREMPRYGCCAQGLVFPLRQLPGFHHLLTTPPFDFPGDMILEGWAGNHDYSKWALDPSVLQHVGLKQSSEGPRLAEIWNFSFERRPYAPSFW
ncbi:hypothetical protein VHEMI00848 [[Torrubiella] hemipterigena]|uniref:Integral membrane protein n=1 Tax=[Torrubiella] hemipterigena TaxID=1531966 RepID=A0A0A1T358_9HYPO|nr:hypothetical protein VHEMI00848 [[Torrubiella] hemipterigena]